MPKSVRLESNQFVFNDSIAIRENIALGFTAGISGEIQPSDVPYTLTVDGTDAISLPAGTTEERPDDTGRPLIRYNTTLSAFEGFSPDAASWGEIGGGVDQYDDAIFSSLIIPGNTPNVLVPEITSTVLSDFDFTSLLNLTTFYISKFNYTIISDGSSGYQNVNVTGEYQLFEEQAETIFFEHIDHGWKIAFNRLTGKLQYIETADIAPIGGGIQNGDGDLIEMMIEVKSDNLSTPSITAINGIVTAGSFIGDGSQLTGIHVDWYVDQYSDATFNTVTANYFIGNGSQLTGIAVYDQYSDVAFDTVTANSFIGDGSQLTGIAGGGFDPNTEEIAIGEGSTAESTSLSIGSYASAIYDSVAIGRQALSKNSSVALGSRANTDDNNGYSVAIGFNSKARGSSIAIGHLSYGKEFSSVALGRATYAYDNSTAIGNQANASGVNSMAIGSAINNTISNSVQIGPNDTSKVTILDSGVVAFPAASAPVIGDLLNGGFAFHTNGDSLVVSRNDNGDLKTITLSGGGGSNFNQDLNTTDEVIFQTVSAQEFKTTSALVVIGSGNIGSAYYNSVAIGRGNTASGAYTSAIGHGNIATQERASAFGYQSTASGTSSLSVGRNNLASGDASASVGFGNTASASRSSAMGYGNTASNSRSSAFGTGVINSVANSTQIGPNNTDKLTILDSGHVVLPATVTTDPTTTELPRSGDFCLFIDASGNLKSARNTGGVIQIITVGTFN